MEESKAFQLLALISAQTYIITILQSAYTLRHLERNTIGSTLVQERLNKSIGAICAGTVLLFIYLLMNLSMFWNSLVIVNMIYNAGLFCYQLRYIFWMHQWQHQTLELDEALLDNPF